MPDVLLINPAWGGQVSRRGSRYNRRWPPLDLLNLAGLLRADGATVELADARAVPTAPAVLRAMAARADTVFITSSPLDRWQCPNLELEYFSQTCRELSHPRLVLLGVHGTVAPAGMLDRPPGPGPWCAARVKTPRPWPVAPTSPRCPARPGCIRAN